MAHLNKLSASSIQAFKRCPMQYRLGYVEGLRADRDSDAQRMGTNWHALHEVYANALAENAPSEYGPNATWEELRRAYAMDAVVTHLNTAYQDVPQWLTPEEWAREREILLQSFIGYQWYWQNDPVEFLASEVPFELPVHEPRTGMPLSTKSVVKVGKIDHLIRWHGAVCVLERKSTSKSVAPDSDFWDRGKKDTQVSTYALALRDMNESGVMSQVLGNAERFGNTLYDVWHKPTIKPAMLTQAETKAFLESGTYCDQPFTVDGDTGGFVTVNGVQAHIEPGKKGFAIRETIPMFGARLLKDIYDRPDHYFARREIARTDDEVRQFRGELFSIYLAQSAYQRSNCWFSNESSCAATFRCSYYPICYGPGASSVCDGTTVPAGFKRLKFVDLTVRGEAPEE